MSPAEDTQVDGELKLMASRMKLKARFVQFSGESQQQSSWRRRLMGQ